MRTSKIKLKYNKMFFAAVLLLFLVAVASAFAADKPGDRYVVNEAFGFGERLEYKVGIIGGVLSGLGGSGGLAISKKPVQRTNSRGDSRDCYQINFWVNSEGVVELTYPVHDKYQTIIDVAGIFPYEFQQRVREAKYKRDFKATFDQLNNAAFVGDKQYKTTDNVQDLLSAMYYLRTMDLSAKKVGDVVVLSNFYKDSVYHLPIKIVKRETVTVPAGKFRTIVVQPDIAEGNLFKFINTVQIWLTDDARKIPVKVATGIVIGKAGAELVRYSGVRGKINAKIE